LTAAKCDLPLLMTIFGAIASFPGRLSQPVDGDPALRWAGPRFGLGAPAEPVTGRRHSGGTEGSQTHRWRELDSNPRSPVGDSIFSRPPRTRRGQTGPVARTGFSRSTRREGSRILGGVGWPLFPASMCPDHAAPGRFGETGRHRVSLTRDPDRGSHPTRLLTPIRRRKCPRAHQVDGASAPMRGPSFSLHPRELGTTPSE
jgi:hypothetical protein